MLRRSIYIFLRVSKKYINLFAHWIPKKLKQIRLPRGFDHSPRCPLDQPHVLRDAR